MEDLFLSDDDLNTLKRQLVALKSKFKDLSMLESKFRTLLRLCTDKTGATKGEYAESLNKRVLCFAPWKMATIDPFGNVYPCCFATPFQNLSDDLKQGFWGGNDFCMGSIKEKGFKEIWNGDRYMRFREICKDPPAFPFCGWCNYRGFGDEILTGIFKDKSLLCKAIIHEFRAKLAWYAK